MIRHVANGVFVSHDTKSVNLGVYSMTKEKYLISHSFLLLILELFNDDKNTVVFYPVSYFICSLSLHSLTPSRPFHDPSSLPPVSSLMVLAGSWHSAKWQLLRLLPT